jgi:hypothetical protein
VKQHEHILKIHQRNGFQRSGRRPSGNSGGDKEDREIRTATEARQQLREVWMEVVHARASGELTDVNDIAVVKHPRAGRHRPRSSAG